MRQCRHCGFKNPDDIEDCLNCGRDLPTTGKEFREGMETVEAAVKGEWSKVAKKSVDDFVTGQQSSIKYKFHPAWILKVKLFRLKQSAIGCLGVLLVIIVLVIIGLIVNKVKTIFK